jgi:hypothetical protein
MIDPTQDRPVLPALDDFRDRLGEEFARVAQSKARVRVRSPVRVIAVSLVVIALGAGVAIAATQTGEHEPFTVTTPNGEVQTIGQTPITVTEQDGVTHSGVMNNGVVVGCPDGTVRVIPETDPTSEQAKQDAQQAKDEWCQNAPPPGVK